MGQLFTRISTGWSDHPPPIENNFVAIKSNIIKRKCLHENNISKKRKMNINDNNNSDYLSFSKRRKSSNFTNTSIISHSFSPMTLFKCQLCYHCFTTKDSYLDHMIICAIERQASVKIVRAKTTYSIQL